MSYLRRRRRDKVENVQKGKKHEPAVSMLYFWLQCVYRTIEAEDTDLDETSCLQCDFLSTYKACEKSEKQNATLNTQ